MIYSIIVGSSCFAFFLILQWSLLFSKIFHNISRVLIIHRCLVAALILIFFILSFKLISITPTQLNYIYIPYAVAYLTFACFYIVYMPFFFTIYTSLSVQTMVIMNDTGAGLVPIESLKSIFASNELVSKRLDALNKNGFLKPKDSNRYCLTFKGKCFSRLFIFLKWLWRLGPGG